MSRKKELAKEINGDILSLAVPNILTNLSVPLLSLVDTAVVGHLKYPYYLGAIAIGSMIFSFLYWGFGFLRMGTTGLTAQFLGRSDKKETAAVGGRAILIALSFGLLLILLAYPVNKIAFALIHASPEVEKFASEYFYIRIFAAPATLSIYVFHGWFLGMQNARFPMYLLISVNLLNVILDLTFIYLFGMKSDGVALGTVIAQYFGMAIGVLLLFTNYRDYVSLINLKAILDRVNLKRFFKVNTDIFFRTLALIFTLGFFTAESAVYGDVVLAANTILLQLWVVLSYSIDGFAFAGESLVGKFKGENNPQKLSLSVRYIFYWGIAISALFTAAYYFFDKQIISLFTDIPDVINTALVFVYWTSLTPVLNSISFIWDGIYIGATATKTMRNTMLAAALVFYLPIYALLKPYWGNNALWFALVMFMVVRAVGLSFFSRKDIFNAAHISKPDKPRELS